MRHVEHFENCLNRRVGDIFHGSKQKAPAFTIFFIGFLIGIIAARIACLCTQRDVERKFTTREKLER